jgi:hypothetical protein
MAGLYAYFGRTMECLRGWQFLLSVPTGTGSSYRIEFVYQHERGKSTVPMVGTEHVLDHKVNRTVTPWLIITFRGHNHEINPQAMDDAMEPLFVRCQVNMVFSGHQHAYVRSYAMRHGQVDPYGKGPMYWTVGPGGDSYSLGP